MVELLEQPQEEKAERIWAQENRARGNLKDLGTVPRASSGALPKILGALPKILLGTYSELRTYFTHTFFVPPAENSKKAAYVRLHNKSYIIYPPPPPQQPVQEGGTRPNVAFCNTSVPLMQPSALIYSV